MNIYITFDYELFFGENTGSAENSILRPTRELIEISEKHGVKFVFFVDAGYIMQLEKYKENHPALQDDYHNVVTQIRNLSIEGHDIQLHIHPHWEDSIYDGSKWVMDTSRYRLHSYSPEQIKSIVDRYKNKLENITGKQVFAYRAGGWCIQPFHLIRNALQINNIWLDCTVFKGGINASKSHSYDFTNAPDKSIWTFETDPLTEQAKGFFTEIPISSYRVSPFFFWKHAFTRIFNIKGLKMYGDGNAVKASSEYLWKLLTNTSFSTVSVDGLKASFLKKAYNYHLINKQSENFVVIGHPKGLTDYSLKKLSEFLESETIKNKVTTFQDNLCS